VTAEPLRRPRGRPRDSSLDARVIEAAERLLVEEGFEATTIQAIAERSGVHASAIYRRWSSRVDIIEQVVWPGLAPLTVRPTGNLRLDLRRFLRSYQAALGTPIARAAMPGLLASYTSTGRSGAPSTWLGVSARPLFHTIVEAAPQGSVDPDIDPDDVFDVLLGAIVATVLIPTVAARNRPVECLVDAAVRLLSPAGVRASH